MDTNPPPPARRDRATVITIAVILTIAIALIGGLAFGFFFYPALIGLAAGWFFYRIIIWQRTRNPIRPLRPPVAEKYNDGQPLGRAIGDEMEMREMEKEQLRYHEELEEEHRHEDEERREEDLRHDPADYEGPPPVNPFP